MSNAIKTNTTLCFYEEPAALHEIKAWEDLKFDDIVYKKISALSPDYLYQDKMRAYIVDLSNKRFIEFDYEFLVALPFRTNIDTRVVIKEVNRLCQEVFVRRSDKNIHSVSSEFYKTIFFGKFNHTKLSELQLQISEIVSKINTEFSGGLLFYN